MNRKHTDQLIRATIADDMFRVFIADTSNSVQACRDTHDLSPLATLMMGRLISAVSLMSAELKNEDSTVSLNLNCEGALQGAIVHVNHLGQIKAYSKSPQVFFENPAENLALAKHIGKGTINIIRDLKLKNPITGICEIISGEIGEDIAHYYLQSEQIPTAISVGVLFGNDACIHSAGGFMIQQMPNADPKVAEQLIQNINATPYLTDLMDMGHEIEDILKRFILKDIEYKVNAISSISYHCDCSKDRFERALITLGVAELKTLADGIDTQCPYCNSVYHFDKDKIQDLISILEINA